MATRPDRQKSEAPLAHGDVPEQDGSEDPGSGLEPVSDAGAPVSPSAAEHVNTRKGDGIASPAKSSTQSGQPGREEKTVTHGVGEGATVSHVNRKQ